MLQEVSKCIATRKKRTQADAVRAAKPSARK
jgi:hypothetical protein